MSKYLLHVLLTVCIAVTCTSLSSCSDNLPTPTEKLSGNTVIVYMGAENSLTSFAQDDIDEMKAAMGDIPDNCQIVIYKDAELKPAIFLLTNKKFSTWREYQQDLNSADMNTMKTVLRDIVKDFPSEKYSLVLWSHGSGWSNAESTKQKSIIIDNRQNNSSDRGSWLHMSQLAEIMKHLPHMEYIFFDACYMQSVEIASYLYTYTDFLIGSPTEIPGNGAPYHLIMKALCLADIQGIVDGYAMGYQEDEYGVLLSALETANFMDFCTATSRYIPIVFQKNGMPQTEDIQIYAPTYGKEQHSQRSIPVPYDIRSAMFHLLTPTDYILWEEAWNKVVPYHTQATKWNSEYPTFYHGNKHCTMTDPEHYGGISMNIPQAEYSERGWCQQFQLSPWYNFTLWNSTGW